MIGKHAKGRAGDRKGSGFAGGWDILDYLLAILSIACTGSAFLWREGEFDVLASIVAAFSAATVLIRTTARRTADELAALRAGLEGLKGLRETAAISLTYGKFLNAVCERIGRRYVEALDSLRKHGYFTLTMRSWSGELRAELANGLPDFVAGASRFEALTNAVFWSRDFLGAESYCNAMKSGLLAKGVDVERIAYVPSIELVRAMRDDVDFMRHCARDVVNMVEMNVVLQRDCLESVPGRFTFLLLPRSERIAYEDVFCAVPNDDYHTSQNFAIWDGTGGEVNCAAASYQHGLAGGITAIRYFDGRFTYCDDGGEERAVVGQLRDVFVGERMDALEADVSPEAYLRELQGLLAEVEVG